VSHCNTRAAHEAPAVVTPASRRWRTFFMEAQRLRGHAPKDGHDLARFDPLLDEGNGVHARMA
jgi:hypothetical protein